MNNLLPNKYTEILAELKTKIKQAKTRAALSVNAELLEVYWEIGKTILDQQKADGWGTKIIDRLSKDLKSDFLEMLGLSVRNIKYMRAFAEAYPDFLTVQVPPAQIQNTDNQLFNKIQNNFMLLYCHMNIWRRPPIKNKTRQFELLQGLSGII